MNYTDMLRDKAYEAEDNGQDIYIKWHDTYEVIEYIEIDGEEIYNPDYNEEVREAYWLMDSYAVAERYARQ